MTEGWIPTFVGMTPVKQGFTGQAYSGGNKDEKCKENNKIATLASKVPMT